MAKKKIKCPAQLLFNAQQILMLRNYREIFINLTERAVVDILNNNLLN